MLSCQATKHVRDPVVPGGHIVVSKRWRDTELVKGLQNRLQLKFEDDLGIVDFYPANHVAVIYVSEADMIGATGYKRKCVILKQAPNVRGVIIAERTSATEQYFAELQIFTAVETDLRVIPVAGQEQAAGVLVQIVHAEGNPDSNMFKRPTTVPCEDDAILTTLQTVPKLGEVKAKLLLAKFKSLHGISCASVEDMTPVVGHACAQDTWTFFNKSPL